MPVARWLDETGELDTVQRLIENEATTEALCNTAETAAATLPETHLSRKTVTPFCTPSQILQTSFLDRKGLCGLVQYSMDGQAMHWLHKYKAASWMVTDDLLALSGNAA